MTAGVDLYEHFRTLRTPCAGGINHWVADVGLLLVSASFTAYTQCIWKCYPSQNVNKNDFAYCSLSAPIYTTEHKRMDLKTAWEH